MAAFQHGDVIHLYLKMKSSTWPTLLDFFSSETTVPLDGTLGKVEKLLCKAVATQVFNESTIKEKIAKF